ncbi:MAG: ethanolamine utilization protein EutH [Endomicrobium sp.]|jgi:ethanolamine transporter|nr:ethanolamine utilization protein EutH [Endomicrobium sp.]
MNINDVIVYIMLSLMCIAVLDHAFSNKLGLGSKYVQAFSAMGTLAMYMLGTLCFAPVLAKALKPCVSPFFNAIGADPCVIAGLLIGSDSGDYPIAVSMAKSAQAADFSGLIIGSMFGICLTFLVPYLLGVADEAERPLIAKGILAGISTIPLGCFAGGLTAGFDLIFIFKNLIPVILFSGFVAAGLIFFQSAAIKIFLAAGKVMRAFLAITLMIAAFEGVSGISVIKGLLPISQAFAIVGNIIVILVGAFVFVHILTKVLNAPIKKLSAFLKVNETSCSGFLCALANTIAMAALIKDMDKRGKILNAAFAVSAGFAFGDHLAFTAGVNKDMILAVVTGKLAGGITALTLACAILRKEKSS